jgi:hypothetical protein
MRQNVVTYALLIVAAFSACKKDTTQTPQIQPTTGEQISVKLNLAGDITTSTSPLGAKNSTGNVTVYGVSVQDTYGNIYAQGAFTNPDSIYITLATNVRYRFKIAAFKKGSGNGFYYDNTTGAPYIGSPIQKPLDNRMIYVGSPNNPYLTYGYLDTLSYLPLANNYDQLSYNYYPEIDSYYGESDYTPRDTSTLSLNLKRLSFGLEYHVNNLNGGWLTVSENNELISADTIRNNGSQPVNIFTANDYKYSDSLYYNALNLSVVYHKDSITSQEIGRVRINPTRNRRTIINVVLPGSTTTTPIINIPDAYWNGANQVNL